MVESSQERAKRNKYRRKKAMLKKVHKKAGIAFLCVMGKIPELEELEEGCEPIVKAQGIIHHGL